MDFAKLTAVCDVFYPRVCLRPGRALLAGAVTMTIYFRADEHEIAAQ